MKTFYLLPLLLLGACAAAPKLTLRSQPSSLATDSVRYPEMIRAYHFGRYADPDDDSLLHEQHTIYRVEENARWDLSSRTATSGGTTVSTGTMRDAAFSPTPVNDAILAEVNSQRLATAQIIRESQTLTAALARFQNSFATNLKQMQAMHANVNDLKQRLAALETATGQATNSPTANHSPTNTDEMIP
jgi:hypothetical protein